MIAGKASRPVPPPQFVPPLKAQVQRSAGTRATARTPVAGGVAGLARPQIGSMGHPLSRPARSE